jgi:CDP-paratose 2-epimerase
MNGKSAGASLITGGAGFLGTNLAHHLLSARRPVVIFDNLSRSGAEKNLTWLRRMHGERLRVIVCDIRDRFALREALYSVKHVYHFAAQVAVTTSLIDPVSDFEVNARGTLNLLEEVRRLDGPPTLIFTSTNKVYGGLSDVMLRRNGNRYRPRDPGIEAAGIGEDRVLDFHSPYGCSKGTADQYVLDYARVYRLPAVVFRMSCIYGPHQYGTEDQGWVAHFLIRAIERQPITIYGDGKQVRDVLYIDDLLDAFARAVAHIGITSGQTYNIGGGAGNTVSLLELLDIIRNLTGEPVVPSFEAWRTGDQRYYVSDFSRFRAATGWAPRVGIGEGLARLHDWLRGTRGLARPHAAAGRMQA